MKEYDKLADELKAILKEDGVPEAEWESYTPLQRQRYIIGRGTSRGYKGKPDEIVEVRGD